MNDTTARLGFEIDPSGLEAGKKGIDQNTDAAKRLEDQAKKTGAALNNVGGNPEDLKRSAAAADQLARSLVGAGQAAGNITSLIEQVAVRTGVSYAQAAASVKNAVDGLRQTAAVSQAAAPAVAAVGNSIAAAGTAAGNAAVVISRKTAAVTDLERAVRRMGPVLNIFDTDLGRVLAASNALRLGFVGLAGVAGGALAFELAKVGDQLQRNQKLFDALTGSSGSGALAKAKESARAAGLEFGTMSDFLQKASQGQETFADKGVIFANAAGKIEGNLGKLSDAAKTLNQIMQAAGATADEEKQVFGAVGDSIQKTGRLTADAFQKIRDVSLPTARAISEAFGFTNLEEFQRELAQTPKPLNELIDRLRVVAPLVDEAFKRRDPTVEQSTRGLATAWNELVEAMSKSGQFSFVSGFISGLTNVLDSAAKNAGALAAGLRAIGNALPGLGPILSGARLGSALGSMGGSDSSGPALSDMGGFGGGGSADSGVITVPSGSDGYVDYSQSYDDSFYGAFAGGGSFTVGGSGGTDSQTVSFDATPGETVTVTTPEQEAQATAVETLTTAISDGSLIKTTLVDEEELLEKQTAKIVSAVNALGALIKQNKDGAIAAAAAPFTGFGDPFGLRSGGGVGIATGGGGSSESPFKKLDEEKKKADQERERRLREEERDQGGPQLSPMMRRFAGQSSEKSGVIRMPVGQFAPRMPVGWDDYPRGLDYGDMKLPGLDDVERNTQGTNRNLDEANRSLDQIDSGTAFTSDQVQQGASNTVDAVDMASDVISRAIQMGLNDMGEAMSSGLGEVASAMANSGGGRGGGSSGGDGFFGGGSSGGGGYYSGGGGYSSGYDGGGGIDYYDSGMDYPSGGVSYDDGYVDYSQPYDDSFYGAFAGGGQFTVGGDGGIDTTPVKFLATRGEVVNITPPGMAPPRSGMSVPSAMLNPAASDTSWQQHYAQSTTQTVNATIVVGSRVQAEDFIRSRAQLNRIMRAAMNG